MNLPKGRKRPSLVLLLGCYRWHVKSLPELGKNKDEDARKLSMQQARGTTATLHLFFLFRHFVQARSNNFSVLGLRTHEQPSKKQDAAALNTLPQSSTQHWLLLVSFTGWSTPPVAVPKPFQDTFLQSSRRSVHMTTEKISKRHTNTTTKDYGAWTPSRTEHKQFYLRNIYLNNLLVQKESLSMA